MLKLNKETKLSPEEVLKKAETFFGTGGYGLEVTSKEPNFVGFEGGGGMVHVIVAKEGDKTSVDLETREWESQIQKFMTSL